MQLQAAEALLMEDIVELGVETLPRNLSPTLPNRENVELYHQFCDTVEIAQIDPKLGQCSRQFLTCCVCAFCTSLRRGVFEEQTCGSHTRIKSKLHKS